MDLNFLDDATNQAKNKEARAEKGLPTKKVSKKPRTKQRKVQQSFSIKKETLDKVKAMAVELDRSENYIVDKLLEYCFEKGIKL